MKKRRIIAIALVFALTACAPVCIPVRAEEKLTGLKFMESLVNEIEASGSRTDIGIKNNISIKS